MLASDIRWKFFVGASQKKGPMTADDVEDIYKKVINPEGVKLEADYESIGDYLASIPGFRKTDDDLFSLSEADALAAFKKQAIKANEKTRAVEAFTKSFSEIYKKEKVPAHHVEKDLLTHFCLTPPPNVEFLEVSRLFDEDVSKHNEAVKKCFKQFKSLVLFHSRAFHLFDEILPLLFTAEQFSKAYCDIFEVDEVPFDELGFSNVQDLLEWLPEIRFRGDVFLVMPPGYKEKEEHVEEIEKDSDDKKKKIKEDEKATEQPPKKKAKIDVPADENEAVPQEKVQDDEMMITETEPLKEDKEEAEKNEEEETVVQEVKEPSVEHEEMTNERTEVQEVKEPSVEHEEMTNERTEVQEVKEPSVEQQEMTSEHKEVQEVKEPFAEHQEMTNEPKEDVNMNLDNSEEKIVLEEEEEVQEEFMEIEEDEQIISRRLTCREDEFDEYDEDAEEEAKKEGDEELEEPDLMNLSFMPVGDDIDADLVDDSMADNDANEVLPTD